MCGNEKIQDDFPVTLCVNAFRGFMNEFMNHNRVDTEKPSKTKRKKGKKQKSEDHIIHGGHVLQMSMINIPTACEVCTSFFLWPIERSLVCRSECNLGLETIIKLLLLRGYFKIILVLVTCF